MTAAGFERLLQRLDADPDRAAAEYELLRLALVKFFDWRGAWEPEECADETVDRLAQKLQGETHVDDVRRYAHGIARLVLLESLRRQGQSPVVAHPHLASFPATSEQETSDLQQCFDRCLAELPDESRTLVLRYYQEGRSKADYRRRLAAAAGFSETALRSRVQRVRDRLEQCVQGCLGEAPTQVGRP